MNDADLRRIAFLLVAPDIDRMSQRWYQTLIRVLTAAGNRGVYGAATGRELGDEMKDRRRSSLVFAVGDVVDRMSPAEKADLAEDRVLPPDFLTRVEERAKAVRQEMQARW